MIYLLTYFVLDHFDAPSIYFKIFWGVIIIEILFSIVGSIVKAISNN